MDDALRNSLVEHQQQDVLRFWDELSDEQQAALESDLRGVDLDAIAEQWRRRDAAGEDTARLARRAEPPRAIRLDGEGNPYSSQEARRRGEEVLRSGEVGAILVAGGQGTRLGFEGPKGKFPIGPVSGHTLYQILLEKTLAAGRRYGKPVPLYVMTSPATHEPTIEFLEANGYFGLPPGDVFPFCQGTMPAVDAQNGRLLMAEKHRLALSPDGHGGILAALRKSRGLEDIRRRRLRLLYYVQVDNPLVPLCDPEFLGYHLLCGSELSTQVIAKKTSRDTVGNVVRVDGQTRIIEYSDLNPLPDEIVQRKTANGKPVFWAGNTAVHVFGTDFLARMADNPGSLPWRHAPKAVAHLNEGGQRIEPSQPNAIKFERFIFDLLPRAGEAIVMEVDAQRTFAPVKNRQGTDSPETAQAQMVALHREWLLSAGAEVAEDAAVEIGPLFALDEEEVRRKVHKGVRVEKRKYFHEGTANER